MGDWKSWVHLVAQAHAETTETQKQIDGWTEQGGGGKEDRRSKGKGKIWLEMRFRDWLLGVE